MEYYYTQMDSPIGWLYIVTTDKFLVGLTPENGWGRLKKKFANLVEKDSAISRQTKLELEEYFDKKRVSFDLPLSLDGTSFQKRAWDALLDIPYGQTISYAKQAENIGNPKAVRAIGGANGANPISIIVPCHRVIGKSGKLTGHASGLEIKEFLLNLESSKLST